MRPELTTHEAAVRAVLREPDALLLDEVSTARRKARGHGAGLVVHYLGASRGRGQFAGKLLCVVVKWLTEGERADQVRGYVSTMFFAADIQPRLRLVWEREP